MKEDTTPLVSVLIPIYNVERYLEQCLESVRSQTLRSIEIVCVDDGSTDRSLEILMGQALQDTRIKTFTKPNGGLSSARNAAIRKAQGSLLVFLDSDDCLEHHACETVFRAFEQHDADIVTFGATCVPWQAGYPTLRYALSPRHAVYSSFEPAILFKEKSRPFVWRCAFRREFVCEHSLFFDENLKFGEDQVFQFMAYPRSQKTVFLSDKLYRYMVKRQGSLMALHNQEPILKLKEHLVIVKSVLLGWREHGWLTTAYAPLMLAWALDFVLIDIYLQRDQQQAECLRILNQIFLEAFDSIDLTALADETATKALFETVLNIPPSGKVDPLRRSLLISFYRENNKLLRSLARCLVRSLRVHRARR